MKNKGWNKLRYRAHMLTAYVCPLCEKPTSWENRTGMPASPIRRKHPDCPDHISIDSHEYRQQWQCSHCKAWHNEDSELI